ncbi:Endonuclease/Exonuclease/phosphatase family protein [Arthrobacter subterraneus]|uniref:Endonuclease/Exonuclease/phosphatase family protein n=2 Tax=Arthrobacter subterraneus TaxID=335973 RepID=A0A1G8Q106_9MICC|nr:Endonuclease/Exonuclease/phosphatase family protein [Arthrobacter subterraneus]
MGSMTSDPPAAVDRDVGRLRAALENAVPDKDDSNLLIGTWNVRAFGDLTEKWTAGSRDSPKRDLHAMSCIAEIASRFDVLAMQEVRRNTTALQYLMGLLGPEWRFITSDVTEGSAGNGERLTYLYDTARVQPSGLVGEIVLPPGTDGPVAQFARTPYAAGFTRGQAGFVLTSVHVLWGDRPADRLPEVTAFAQWMRDWAERPDDWNENLLVLGDFNLDRIGDPLYEAFVSTGLWAPTELDTVPRTIFDNDKTRHYYDQIAWFSKPDGTSMLQTLTYTGRAGHVDFLPHILTGLTKNEVSWRISDHYPLWAEFST